MLRDCQNCRHKTYDSQALGLVIQISTCINLLLHSARVNGLLGLVQQRCCLVLTVPALADVEMTGTAHSA